MNNIKTSNTITKILIAIIATGPIWFLFIFTELDFYSLAMFYIDNFNVDLSGTKFDK